MKHTCKCKWCGKAFTSKHKNTKFCSAQCSNIHDKYQRATKWEDVVNETE